MMRQKFYKITAQGNDYIYFDLRHDQIGELDWQNMAQVLSERHFGIGSDGLVLINKSEIADAEMRILNADGSEGKMCGSALRSIAFLILHQNKSESCLIQSASGLHRAWIEVYEGEKLITVEMGDVQLISREMEKNELLILVDTGNLHQVRYLNDIDKFDLHEKMSQLLPLYENEAWNFEFIEVDTAGRIRLQVWEHGSGETLACGSGAVAAVFAGWETGRIQRSPIRVDMPGGFVFVQKKDDKILLSGSVEKVFTGEIDLSRWEK